MLYKGCDLHSKIWIVFTRKHHISHLIKNLGQFSSMFLADRIHNTFTNFITDWVTQCIFHKSFAKKPVGCFWEKLLFKLLLLIWCIHILPIIIFYCCNIPLIRKQLRGYIGTRIQNNGIDQKTVPYAIKQRIAVSGISILASECAISVHQKTPFKFPWVSCGWFILIKLFKIILGCSR